MAIKYYRLLDMIQRKGLSKTEFTKLVGLSPTTMAKLSNHRPVNLEIIDRICETLDCQPGDIMEFVKSDELN